jgi:hypothetical protein
VSIGLHVTNQLTQPMPRGERERREREEREKRERERHHLKTKTLQLLDLVGENMYIRTLSQQGMLAAQFSRQQITAG